MRKVDVQIGTVYIAKVSGTKTRVRLTAESRFGGWDAINLATQRPIRIRTAARLTPCVAPDRKEQNAT